MPKLKVVMEHITTSEAVAFVTAAPANVAATITPQHLLYNRNAIFQVRCSSVASPFSTRTEQFESWSWIKFMPGHRISLSIKYVCRTPRCRPCCPTVLFLVRCWCF